MAGPLRTSHAKRLLAFIITLAIVPVGASGPSRAAWAGPPPPPPPGSVPQADPFSDDTSEMSGAADTNKTSKHSKKGKKGKKGKSTSATPATPPPPPSPDVLAIESFKTGQQLYAQRHYEQALQAYLHAYELMPAPDFLYNVGVCHEALGRPSEAMEAFRTYLEKKPEASDRAAVEQRLVRLEARHQELELERARNTPVAPTRTVDSRAAPREIRAGRWLLVTGGVVFAAGASVAIGGGASFGLAARERSTQVSDPIGKSYEQVKTLDREGRRLETLQLVTVGIGAAVAIVGAALVALGIKRIRNASGAKQLSWSPVGSRDTLGVAIGGRF